MWASGNVVLGKDGFVKIPHNMYYLIWQAKLTRDCQCNVVLQAGKQELQAAHTLQQAVDACKHLR